MNKKFDYVILFTPTIFISLFIDAYFGCVFGYFLVVIHLIYIIKKCDIKYLIISNIISCIISYILAIVILNDKWNYYFKPFLASDLVILISIISLIIQIVIKRKNKDKYVI